MIHAFGRIQYFPSTDMLDLCAKQVCIVTVVVCFLHDLIYFSVCLRSYVAAGTKSVVATAVHLVVNTRVNTITHPQVTSKVDFFLTEELANTLWGFAALNYHPGPLVGLVARKVWRGCVHKCTSVVGDAGCTSPCVTHATQAQQERVSGWQLKTLTWCYTVFQFKDA